MTKRKKQAKKDSNKTKQEPRIGVFVCSCGKNIGGVVDVKGVTEAKRVNMQYEQFKYLNDSGVNIRPDHNKYTMHHKVIIIDNSTVITGSYNPTKSGDTKNDENVVIIHDPAIAGLFLGEFEKVWENKN